MEYLDTALLIYSGFVVLLLIPMPILLIVAIIVRIWK